jgi:pectin methylesterase-like acyl-CoA thioesterase
VTRPIRTLALMLAVGAPLALGACGDSDTSTTPTDAATTATATSPAPSSGDAASGATSAQLNALTAFAACMRKQGIALPKPDPDDPFSVLHSLDQNDPEVAQALPACQDKLAALNSGQ